MSQEIFRIASSNEKDRPVIDFEDPRNRASDEDVRLYDILCFREPAINIPKVKSYWCDHPNALNWDYYFTAGGDIYSLRLIEALRPAIRDFMLVERPLNGSPYYYLYPQKRLNILDRDKSKLLILPSHPEKVVQISHFVFRAETLQDPLMFCIPELVTRKFVTPGVKDLITQAGCRGIELEILP